MSVFLSHSPLKQATFLQQFDSMWVSREGPQEEEVVLAKCGEQAVALQTSLWLQTRRWGQPWHHVPNQVLEIPLAILVHRKRRETLGNVFLFLRLNYAKLCVCVNFSDLIWVHEELNKLTADHSELSSLWVIQRKPSVQLTAGLVKVQQPPHKPAFNRQRPNC